MASKDFKIKNAIVVDDITIDLSPVSSYKGFAYDESTSSFTGSRDGVPVGVVRLYAANPSSFVLPDDYLLCDGSEISTSTYATLFDVIGYKFSTGAGGTFKLPNFNSPSPVDRIIFPIGIDPSNMAGVAPTQTGGEPTLTVTESISIAHTHTTGNDMSTLNVSSTNLGHTHNTSYVNYEHKHAYEDSPALNTRVGGDHSHNTGNASTAHSHSYLSGNGNFIETAGYNAGHGHNTSDFIGGHSHTDQAANHGHNVGTSNATSNTHQHSFSMELNTSAGLDHTHSVDAASFYFIIKYR
jgi:microcystin-dependent protein